MGNKPEKTYTPKSDSVESLGIKKSVPTPDEIKNIVRPTPTKPSTDTPSNEKK